MSWCQGKFDCNQHQFRSVKKKSRPMAKKKLDNDQWVIVAMSFICNSITLMSHYVLKHSDYAILDWLERFCSLKIVRSNFCVSVPKKKKTKKLCQQMWHLQCHPTDWLLDRFKDTATSAIWSKMNNWWWKWWNSQRRTKFRRRFDPNQRSQKNIMNWSFVGPKLLLTAKLRFFIIF